MWPTTNIVVCLLHVYVQDLRISNLFENFHHTFLFNQLRKIPKIALTPHPKMYTRKWRSSPNFTLPLNNTVEQHNNCNKIPILIETGTTRPSEENLPSHYSRYCVTNSYREKVRNSRLFPIASNKFQSCVPVTIRFYKMRFPGCAIVIRVGPVSPFLQRNFHTKLPTLYRSRILCQV